MISCFLVELRNKRTLFLEAEIAYLSNPSEILWFVAEYDADNGHRITRVPLSRDDANLLLRVAELLSTVGRWQ